MIPKVFHFIWIGPGEPPERRRAWIDTWRHHHPDWEVRVWRDGGLPELRHRNLFDRARAAAVKAAVLRAEILHVLGGVYVDTDMECLRPLGPLLAGCEGFVARTEPDGGIGGSLFGAVPSHGLTRRLLDQIPRRFHPDKAERLGAPLVARAGRRLNHVRTFEHKLFDAASGAAYALRHSE